jgi:hypothetical protein
MRLSRNEYYDSCRKHNGNVQAQPPVSPTLLFSLSQLEEQLKAAYKLVTEGKFGDALKVRVCMSVCPFSACLNVWASKLCIELD